MISSIPACIFGGLNVLVAEYSSIGFTKFHLSIRAAFKVIKSMINNEKGRTSSESAARIV